MNTETDKFNIYDNDMKFAKRNVPNERNNKNVTMREYSRFMASLICQSNQIENDFKEILKQNKISSEELEKIQSSCEYFLDYITKCQS